MSQHRIADAALDLVERTGDVQMVALAQHLGVAPSSLYGHVRGRDEVIDLARLRMLARMEPLSPEQDWRRAVEGLLRQLADHYSRHVRLLPLIFTTTVADERAIAVCEPVFATLFAAVCPPGDLRLVIALVESQAMGVAVGLPAPAMSEEIRRSLPGYTASIDHSRHDHATALDFSVRVVLSGLESVLSTVGRDGTPHPGD